jgi:hypothetical protein
MTRAKSLLCIYMLSSHDAAARKLNKALDCCFAAMNATPVIDCTEESEGAG